MKETTLSVALIARDEEHVIGRVLGDVANFADEIVVLDTGSSDRTAAIAQEYGARVYDYEWADDFAAARNAAFDKCRSDWIMWIDADDRVPREAQLAFARAKERLSKEAVAMLVYVPYHLEYAAEDSASFVGAINRVRISRRDGAFRWLGRIHEALYAADAAAIWLDDAWVEHRPVQARAAAKYARDRHILEAALREGDRAPMILLHYGLLLAALEEFSLAARALEECLVVCDAPAPRYVALLMAGVCAGGLGDLARRAEYLYEALDLDSHRAEAFVDLGIVHEIVGDHAGAIPFFRAAIGLTPPKLGNYAVPAYTWAPLAGMARCTWSLGRAAEARRWLAKATHAAPHQRDAFRRLADEFEASADAMRGASTKPTHVPVGSG